MKRLFRRCSSSSNRKKDKTKNKQEQQPPVMFGPQQQQQIHHQQQQQQQQPQEPSEQAPRTLPAAAAAAEPHEQLEKAESAHSTGTTMTTTSHDGSILVIPVASNNTASSSPTSAEDQSIASTSPPVQPAPSSQAATASTSPHVNVISQQAQQPKSDNPKPSTTRTAHNASNLLVQDDWASLSFDILAKPTTTGNNVNTNNGNNSSKSNPNSGTGNAAVVASTTIQHYDPSTDTTVEISEDDYYKHCHLEERTTSTLDASRHSASKGSNRSLRRKMSRRDSGSSSNGSSNTNFTNANSTATARRRQQQQQAGYLSSGSQHATDTRRKRRTQHKNANFERTPPGRTKSADDVNWDHLVDSVNANKRVGHGTDNPNDLDVLSPQQRRVNRKAPNRSPRMKSFSSTDSLRSPSKMVGATRFNAGSMANVQVPLTSTRSSPSSTADLSPQDFLNALVAKRKSNAPTTVCATGIPMAMGQATSTPRSNDPAATDGGTAGLMNIHQLLQLKNECSKIDQKFASTNALKATTAPPTTTTITSTQGPQKQASNVPELMDVSEIMKLRMQQGVVGNSSRPQASTLANALAAQPTSQTQSTGELMDVHELMKLKKGPTQITVVAPKAKPIVPSPKEPMDIDNLLHKRLQKSTNMFGNQLVSTSAAGAPSSKFTAKTNRLSSSKSGVDVDRLLQMRLAPQKGSSMSSKRSSMSNLNGRRHGSSNIISKCQSMHSFQKSRSSFLLSPPSLLPSRSFSSKCSPKCSTRFVSMSSKLSLSSIDERKVLDGDNPATENTKSANASWGKEDDDASSSPSALSKRVAVSDAIPPPDIFVSPRPLAPPATIAEQTPSSFLSPEPVVPESFDMFLNGTISKPPAKAATVLDALSPLTPFTATTLATPENAPEVPQGISSSQPTTGVSPRNILTSDSQTTPSQIRKSYSAALLNSAAAAGISSEQGENEPMRRSRSSGSSFHSFVSKKSGNNSGTKNQSWGTVTHTVSSAFKKASKMVLHKKSKLSPKPPSRNTVQPPNNATLVPPPPPALPLATQDDPIFLPSSTRSVYSATSNINTHAHQAVPQPDLNSAAFDDIGDLFDEMITDDDEKPVLGADIDLPLKPIQDPLMNTGRESVSSVSSSSVSRMSRQAQRYPSGSNYNTDEDDYATSTSISSVSSRPSKVSSLSPPPPLRTRLSSSRHSKSGRRQRDGLSASLHHDDRRTLPSSHRRNDEDQPSVFVRNRTVKPQNEQVDSSSMVLKSKSELINSVDKVLVMLKDVK